jgi:hypothetical protein
MAFALPPPQVPDLKPANYIDMDELGNADLRTYVDYPGIKVGDRFWARWWGCGAQGQAEDYVDTLTEVDGNLDPVKGMPVDIENALLRALDQGWVFYSYVMEDTNQPDDRGEESLRRFFYIGKRDTSASALAVPQCRESHALNIDPGLTGISDVTFVTPPYRAMQAGDKVTLQLDLYFADGSKFATVFEGNPLTEAEVGQPIEWSIEYTNFMFIADGHALVRYAIEYADPTSTTESATQRLEVVSPSAALLPAPTIKDFSGGELDPEAYPAGIKVQVELYPGIQVDDDVVLYASADTREVKTLRVDPTTIASQVLQFTLDYAWLSANNGKSLELVYQFARVGHAGTSQPFSVMLRKPLNLPFPIVERATVLGEGEGTIPAGNVINGVYIRVPDEAVIGADDTVQMHWDGFGSTGSHVADPTLADSRRFFIPGAAVPANMGKHVRVYYRVTPLGGAGGSSSVFDLQVTPMESGWPTIQFRQPPAQNNEISLAQVPEAGAVLELASWSFMAEGQRVRIRAAGLPATDGNGTEDMRIGAAERVTEDEFFEGRLSVKLTKAFLGGLTLNHQFRVTVETSFDDGNEYRPFPNINIVLRQ